VLADRVVQQTHARPMLPAARAAVDHASAQRAAGADSIARSVRFLPARFAR
jgi:hypothetical protein